MAATTIVLYKTPSDPEKFDAYYFGTHMPLVQKVPGLLRAEVQRFRGKSAPYYLLTTLYFNNKDEQKAAWNTPEGQAVTADVPNFAEEGQATLISAETVDMP
jgi:uncharacterized protein (TIGR02118 family)